MTLAVCDSACHGDLDDPLFSYTPAWSHSYFQPMGWYSSGLGKTGNSAWEWIEHAEVPNVKVISLEVKCLKGKDYLQLRNHLLAPHTPIGILLEWVLIELKSNGLKIALTSTHFL